MFLIDWPKTAHAADSPGLTTTLRAGPFAGRELRLLIRPSSRTAVNASGTIRVLCNGYLSRSDAGLASSSDPLQSLLEGPGHPLSTKRERLKGCFFACFIDFETDSITGVRDGLGGRGGFYHETADRLLIASHAQLIARHPAYRFSERPEYFATRIARANMPRPGESPFENIHAFVPGEQRCWRPGKTTELHRPMAIPTRFSDPGEAKAVQGLKKHLERSVAVATRQSSHLFSLLSGGLDSAPATAVALEQARQIGTRVQTVSWLLPGLKIGNEQRSIAALEKYLLLDSEHFDGRDHRPYADLTTAQINPDWMEFNPFRPLLDQCIAIAANRGADSLMNCTAGDFHYPQSIHLLPGLYRNRDWSHLVSLLGVQARHWRQSGYRIWQDPALRHIARRALSSAVSRLEPISRYRRDLFTDSFRTRLPPAWRGRPDFLNYPVPEHAATFVGRAFAFNRSQESYFAERQGLQYFDPYQDEDLAEFMLALPFHYATRHGQSKWIMRQAMAGRLPEPFLGKRRTGNLLPFLVESFQQNRNRIAERVLDHSAIWADYLKIEAIEALIKKDSPSEADIMLVNQLLGYILWREYWSSPPKLN